MHIVFKQDTQWEVTGDKCMYFKVQGVQLKSGPILI
jgi:hypothetical protein